MDIGSLGALTPVSAVSRSANDQGSSTTAESTSPAVVSAIAEPGTGDLRQRMAAVASQLQEFLNSSQRDVEFSVEPDTHVQVVTVRDTLTGQVIRQFPNEDVIRVVRNLTAQQGTLLDEAV